MRLRFLSTVSVLVLSSLAPQAHAGFEFVAPVKPQASEEQPAAPVTEQSPVVANDMIAVEPLMPEPAVATSAPMEIGSKAIPLTPIVKESDALLVDDMPMALPMPVAKTPVIPAPVIEQKTASISWDSMPPPPVLPVASTPAMPKIAASEIDDGMPIEGFGRQVPLVLALQQIAPPEYRYAFDDGVDPGMRISWTGGKSWKAVITDVARTNGLSVDIVSNVIAFHRRSPMEIVEAQTAMDTSADTVQGMKLHPVADMNAMPTALPMPIAEPILSDEPVVADATMPAEKPMSILQPLGSISMEQDDPTGLKEQLDVARAEAAAPSPAATNVMEPAGVEPPAILDDAALAEKKAVDKQKEEKIAKTGDAKFEPLLDSSDKPASRVVKNKEILTADDTPTTVTPTAIAVEPLMPAPVAPEAKAPEIVFDDAPAAIAETSAVVEPVKLIADLTTPSEWEGHKNKTLRDVLGDWTGKAGVSLVWSSEFDYPLQTDVRIQGTFPDAVRTLLAGFGKAQPRPIGRLFKNKSVGAEPVLVVETQRLTD